MSRDNLSKTLSSQLSLALATASKKSEHDHVVESLLRREKTIDDAKLLFEKIKSFSFFQNFFSHYIKDMDMHSILALCKSFTYEKFSAHDVIMKQKDPSNDKFYVILSGEVAVCVKSDNLGKFGEIPTTSSEADVTFVDGVELHKGKKLKRQKKPLSISLAPEQIFPLRNSKRHSSYHSVDKNSDSTKSAGKKVYHKSIFAQRAVRDPLTPDETQPTSPNGTAFPHGTSHFSPRQQIPSSLIQAANESRKSLNNSLTNAKSTESVDALPAPPAFTKNASDIKPSTAQLVSRKPRSVRKLTEVEADISSVNVKRIFKGLGEPKSATMTPMQPGSLNYLDGGSIWGETDRDDDQFDSLKFGETEEEKSELEALAEPFGRIVTYLKEGESFGEVALKRSIPRTATILCKTDCEFIVMLKDQYELGFGRMQREKEEFLLSVFPMMKNISSTLNYNYLIYNFKTERHLRGAYLINEGRVREKEAKFYLIQHGECIIEKLLLKEIADPYDLHKKLVSNVEKVTITVAGKGVIVGEEILITGDEYQYGIRVLSELAIVQAITKKEFEQKFPSEFHSHIKGLFEKKRAHREMIFEQIKKEHGLKIAQYKSDNVYCLKNRGIKDYLIKPALQGFSKYLNRGNKLWDGNDPVLAELHNPDKKSHKGSQVLDNTTFTQGDEYTKREGKGSAKNNESEKDKEEKELLGRFGIVDTKQNTRIIAKIEFLNKISDQMIEKAGKVKLDTDNPFILDPTKGKRDSVKPVRRKRILSAHPTNGRLTAKEPNSSVSLKQFDPVVSKINIKKEKKGDDSIVMRPSFITEPVQINSARLDNKSQDFRMRSITDNEFKSLYSQTLTKGSARKTIISHTNSPAGSMNYIKTLPDEVKSAGIRGTSRDSFRRNLYVSTLPTEPNSGSKADLGSSNFLKPSPRLDYEPDSATYEIKNMKSLNSLSYIPSYVDHDFKHFIGSPAYKESPGVNSPGLNGRIMSATIRPSTHQGLKTVITNINVPGKEVKRAKMKASDANLHKVKEWRQKVFRKPTRTFSEADVKTREFSLGNSKAR